MVCGAVRPAGLSGGAVSCVGGGRGRQRGGWRLDQRDRCPNGRRRRRGGDGDAALGGRVQRLDQRRVVPGGLAASRLQAGDDRLDAIKRGEDQADAVGRDRQRAITVAAEHVLRRMRHGFEPRKAEKTAGALDRVHQAEDFRQGGLVVRRALQPQQGGIERGQPFMRFGQEVGQQIVHRHPRGSVPGQHAGAAPNNR